MALTIEQLHIALVEHPHTHADLARDKFGKALLLLCVLLCPEKYLLGHVQPLLSTMLLHTTKKHISHALDLHHLVEATPLERRHRLQELVVGKGAGAKKPEEIALNDLHNRS